MTLSVSRCIALAQILWSQGEEEVTVGEEQEEEER